MRQDDTGLTGVPVPKHTVIPTYNHGDWLQCLGNKESVFPTVRVQEYTTYNTLKPIKNKSTNTEIDTPVNKETKQPCTNKKTKYCVKWFLGNCSSFSVKMKE